MKARLGDIHGFGLIEITMLIIVVGIVAGIAIQSMTVAVNDIRRTKTEREMEDLSNAIVGDPTKMQDGERSDFGYIGDVGAFPSNLNALYTDPGGLPTWNGPYVDMPFEQDSVSYRYDEWGQAYAYSGGLTISSPGGGTTISKKIADATSDYLYNTLEGYVTDKNDSTPGLSYRDSVRIVLTYPRGTSGILNTMTNPNSSGEFTFDSIPAGRHLMRVVWSPTNDTTRRYVTVLPRHQNNPPLNVRLPMAFTTTLDSDLIMIPGSDSVSGSPPCTDVSLWIRNLTGASVTISTIRVNWGSPAAYYGKVLWNGATVFDLGGAPRGESGTVYPFSSSKTIANGQSIKLEILDFRTNNTNGGGNPVSMSGVTLTIQLSDGSDITEVLPSCP